MSRCRTSHLALFMFHNVCTAGHRRRRSIPRPRASRGGVPEAPHWTPDDPPSLAALLVEGPGPMGHPDGRGPVGTGGGRGAAQVRAWTAVSSQSAVFSSSFVRSLSRSSSPYSDREKRTSVIMLAWQGHKAGQHPPVGQGAFPGERQAGRLWVGSPGRRALRPRR